MGDATAPPEAALFRTSGSRQIIIAHRHIVRERLPLRAGERAPTLDNWRTQAADGGSV
jgi:hypothetical protein